MPGYKEGVPSSSWDQVRIVQDGRKDTVLQFGVLLLNPLKTVQNILQIFEECWFDCH